MARGVNKVILVGNIGDDPETKYTHSGMAVTKVRLATTSVRKDRDGNAKEETQWHRVTFFGKLAEIAGEYLRKGSQVYVEGSIKYSESEKDGVKRYYTDIIADEMQMLGGKRDDGDRGQAPKRQERSPNAGSSRAPMASQHATEDDDFLDSDLPF